MGALDLDDVPRCRVCGCTEEHGCPGGCWWVEDPEGGELCSACAAHDDGGDLVDSIQEDLDESRASLAAADASGDLIGAVLSAGRVLACHLEAVVADCGNCRGIGMVDSGEGEILDGRSECPDCAPERQAIEDWGKANGRLQREKQAHPEPASAPTISDEELDRR